MAEKREGGGLELIPQHAVDAAQAWFWSERWQAMERAANADIAAGRVQRFNSAVDFLAELDTIGDGRSPAIVAAGRR